MYVSCVESVTEEKCTSAPDKSSAPLCVCVCVKERQDGDDDDDNVVFVCVCYSSLYRQKCLPNKARAFLKKNVC